MSIPTPFVVQRLEWSAGTYDERGNPTDAWGTASDVPVHGWAPAGADSENNSHADTVIHDVDLYAPAGTSASPRDRFIVAGETFDVVGEIEDYTHGPWQWSAGVRINLKRVEG